MLLSALFIAKSNDMVGLHHHESTSGGIEQVREEC